MSPAFSVMVLICFGIPLVLFFYGMTHSWIRASLVGLVAMILGYVVCNEIGKLSAPKTSVQGITFNEHVEGCLDEITSGSDHRFAKDIGYFTVFQGSKLMIQGWIGSIADIDAVVKVSFLTKGGEETGLEFMALPNQRYDVAEAKHNLDLLNSGFAGTVTVPRDFPPGAYLLRVEKGVGSKRQFFIPETEIHVAPSNSPEKA